MLFVASVDSDGKQVGWFYMGPWKAKYDRVFKFAADSKACIVCPD